ncbi:MAG: response regulator [Phenylobacterium sp.]|uniref:response regulator n=1 Tax=Phenylobacterium sp. TaxID=1871053 RepID=UPI0025CDEF6D|nr:response regulator [Phenylobacterium sp.]MBI1199198.1 response regulator [Phenylobacterium sp.]
MTFLREIAPFIPPASPDDRGETIFRRFEIEPDTMAIAIVDDDGRPLGLVERNSFLVRMAAQHGHALWSRRPISAVMQTDPLVAEGDLTVEQFCGEVLEERPSELLHGFIVTRNGRYAGVGAMLALLQASAAAATLHASQARDALAARARFLAVMSHEIRTPLNGVLSVAEIIRRKSADPSLRPLVDTIVESGGVLLRLLNDALDLSRAEASGLELDVQPFDVAGLLDEIANLWSPQAEIKGVRLDTRFAGPAGLWLAGDAIRLRQILNNLISNALKFAASRIDVRILATESASGAVRVEASIADDGPGVPPDRRDNIFAPFQQTEEGARLGGAGLGLAVCRQLVEVMGGVIAAGESDYGGARLAFEIELPRAHAPGGAEPAPVGHAVEDAARAAHVLIADDNPTNRMVARQLCEIFGLSAECVDDGAEAVEAARSGRFDLILMDIQMPGMNGVDATHAIRSMRTAVALTPIIALTANAGTADATFYRRAGMNGVVAKPINPEELLRAIDDVLASAAEPEQAFSVA